jgi:putative membrane protein
MIRYIIKLVVVAGSLILATNIVDGFDVDSFWPTAVLAAFILGILSITVRPLLKLFSLPITIMTLGLFGFLINIGVFWLLTFIPGVSISNFMAAFWGLIIVTVAGWIVDIIFKK